MSIEEIAEVSNNSVHPVTLNFVMFDGFEYSADKIISLFNPHKVFIKINYIDRNTFTDALDLRDSPKKKVMAFYNKLARRHFSMAFRGN
jgi:adenine C2-methylase RlmN of 23S rRNA A2503 and tRNA A37